MSRGAVADRFLARLARRNLAAISAGMVPSDVIPELRKAANQVPAGLYVYDAGAMTTQDILAAARAQHARTGLALVIVDHLQYLADRPERGETRTQLVGRMAKSLKAMARKLGCAVLLLSQLSRACEQREDKRPILSDLRDSGEIEQDADTVIMLYREHVYRKTANPRACEVIIAKQRNGPTGAFEMDWQADVVAFSERVWMGETA